MKSSAATVAVPRERRHVQRLDGLRATPAKAVQKIDLGSWKAQIGRAIARCFSLAGLSQKEAAALLERDQSQIARWTDGEDRPQLDALFAVAILRKPLIHALAELADDVLIETVIRMENGGRR